MSQVLPFSFLCTPIQKLPSSELVQQFSGKRKMGEKFPVLSHRQIPSGLALVRRAEEKVAKYSLYFYPVNLLFSDPF